MPELRPSPMEWPAKATPDLLRALLMKASTLEVGMAIPIQGEQKDLEKCLDLLKKARRLSDDFDNLMICHVASDMELWVVQKSVEMIP